MIQLRPSLERGSANLDWLTARHSFSFGDYHDAKHMGFGDLRVINEDRIEPGTGFDTHGHRNMEIITYVLSGELAHRDTLGNTSVIRPGDVQRMTAGSGIRHSEINPSASDPVHLLQIWIEPEREGLPPGYEQKHFHVDEPSGQLKLLAARDGRDGALTIHQDVDLYRVLLAAGQNASLALRDGRRAWIQVARGTLEVNGVALGPGDGAAITEESEIAVRATEGAEALLFDLSGATFAGAPRST